MQSLSRVNRVVGRRLATGAPRTLRSAPKRKFGGSPDYHFEPNHPTEGVVARLKATSNKYVVFGALFGAIGWMQVNSYLQHRSMLLLEPIPALLAAATNQEPGVVYDNAPFQDDAEWDSLVDQYKERLAAESAAAE